MDNHLIFAGAVFLCMSIFRHCKKHMQSERRSLVNPKGGTVNCLACTLAAIKTAATGKLYVASPSARIDKFTNVAQFLGKKSTHKQAFMNGRCWTARDIELWLDQTYPKPVGKTQHFFIAVMSQPKPNSKKPSDGHALYGCRRWRNGRLETRVICPQTGGDSIDENLYYAVGATLVDPKKLNRRILSYYKVRKKAG